MTGYQEILTDPSYCGQIVTMTYPLIGNYGINDEDPESRRVFAEGLIVRELSRTYSNWRAGESLDRLSQERRRARDFRHRYTIARAAHSRARLDARMSFDSRKRRASR